MKKIMYKKHKTIKWWIDNKNLLIKFRTTKQKKYETGYIKNIHTTINDTTFIDIEYIEPYMDYDGFHQPPVYWDRYNITSFEVVKIFNNAEKILLLLELECKPKISM